MSATNGSSLKLLTIRIGRNVCTWYFRGPSHGNQLRAAQMVLSYLVSWARPLCPLVGLLLLYTARQASVSTQSSGFPIPANLTEPNFVTGRVTLCSLHIVLYYYTHCMLHLPQCLSVMVSYHNLRRRQQQLFLSFLLLEHWDRPCDKPGRKPFQPHSWHPGSCGCSDSGVDCCYCGNPCYYCTKEEETGT